MDRILAKIDPQGVHVKYIRETLKVARGQVEAVKAASEISTRQRSVPAFSACSPVISARFNGEHVYTSFCHKLSCAWSALLGVNSAVGPL